jgi:hypothetical protein
LCPSDLAYMHTLNFASVVCELNVLPILAMAFTDRRRNSHLQPDRSQIPIHLLQSARLGTNQTGFLGDSNSASQPREGKFGSCATVNNPCSSNNSTNSKSSSHSVSVPVALSLSAAEKASDASAPAVETILSLLELEPFRLLTVRGVHYDTARVVLSRPERMHDPRDDPAAAYKAHKSHKADKAHAQPNSLWETDPLLRALRRCAAPVTVAGSGSGGALGTKSYVDELVVSVCDVCLEMGLQRDEVVRGLWHLQRAGYLTYSLSDACLWLDVHLEAVTEWITAHMRPFASRTRAIESDIEGSRYTHDTNSSSNSGSSSSGDGSGVETWLFPLASAVTSTLDTVARIGAGRTEDMWRLGTVVAATAGAFPEHFLRPGDKEGGGGRQQAFEGDGGDGGWRCPMELSSAQEGPQKGEEGEEERQQEDIRDFLCYYFEHLSRGQEDVLATRVEAASSSSLEIAFLRSSLPFELSPNPPASSDDGQGDNSDDNDDDATHNDTEPFATTTRSATSYPTAANDCTESEGEIDSRTVGTTESTAAKETVNDQEKLTTHRQALDNPTAAAADGSHKLRLALSDGLSLSDGSAVRDIVSGLMDSTEALFLQAISGSPVPVVHPRNSREQEQSNHNTVVSTTVAGAGDGALPSSILRALGGLARKAVALYASRALHGLPTRALAPTAVSTGIWGRHREVAFDYLRSRVCAQLAPSAQTE